MSPPDPAALRPAGLPPHLREVCDLLARGLLRLRSRASEELAREAERARDRGEPRLHFVPTQRRHANPERKGDA